MIVANHSRIALACPAKVNLVLSVGSMTAASSLHPIVSWMVAVTLFDDLALERADDQTSFDIAFHHDAPVSSRVDWTPEEDLAHRAHLLLESHVGRPLPVQVTLRKRIPTGSGLGGGSSNAAGALIGLNHLLGLGLDGAVLEKLASKLGSDVPFLLCDV